MKLEIENWKLEFELQDRKKERRVFYTFIQI